jgi:hypothetical protein
MPHIRVNRQDLTVSVERDPAMDGISIPSDSDLKFVDAMPTHRLVYDLLYQFRHAEDRARGITGRRYKLGPPDPWLVAIVAVMWEGLVQGLTWDAIKIAVMQALRVLRRKRLAPPEGVHSVRSTTRAGFSWTKFSRDGKPLHDLFVGVERKYEEHKRTTGRRRKRTRQ